MLDATKDGLLKIYSGFMDMLLMLLGMLVMAIFLVVLMLKITAIAASSLAKDVETITATAAAAQADADEMEDRVEHLTDDLAVAETERDLAEAQREQVAEQADRFRDDLEQLKERGRQERLQFDKEREHLIRSRSVYCVICCDASMSMEPSIASLNRCIRLIAETIPAAIEDFRLGIVFYRGGDLIELPVKPIVSADRDGGESMRRAQQFVAGLKLESQFANIDTAAEAAMKMLDKEPERSKKLLFLIGDQSTGEMPTHGPGDDAVLLARIRGWAGAPGSDRRVLGLYPSAKKSKAHAFFESLGEINDVSDFGRDPSRMFSMIFRAAFRK